MDYPQGTVLDLFEESAAKYPDKPAVVFFRKAVPYRRLADLVRRLAAALKGLGLGPGDRAALLLANCPQYVASF